MTTQREIVVLTLQVDRSQLQQGLTAAQKQLDVTTTKAETFGTKGSGAFQRFGSRVKGAAGQLPIVGGALTQLLTPMGLATAAIGGVVAGLTASVTSAVNLSKELNTLRLRSGASAEGLQTLAGANQRLGGTGGVEDVAEAFFEMNNRLGELAVTGGGPAKEALEALGIGFEDIQDLSPEEQFRIISTAVAGVEDPMRKAYIQEELFGGASEKLGGILNSTVPQIEAAADATREAGIQSEEAVDKGAAFATQMDELKGALSGVALEVGNALIPVLQPLIKAITDFIPILKDNFKPIWDVLVEVFNEDLLPALQSIWETIRNDLLPALQSIWNSLSPVIIPILKVLVSILINNVKAAFETVSGILKVVAALLRGDFAGAWNAVRETVYSVVINILKNLQSLVSGAADLLGKLGINLDGVEEKLDNFIDKLEEEAQAYEDTSQQNAAAAEAAAQTIGEEQDKIEESHTDATAVWVEGEQERRDAIEETVGFTKEKLAEIRKANAEFFAKEQSELAKQLGLSETEWKRYQIQVKLGRIKWTSELLEIAEKYGTDDLAVAAAHRDRLKKAEKAANDAKVKEEERHQREVTKEQQKGINTRAAAQKTGNEKELAEEKASNAKKEKEERRHQNNLNPAGESNPGGQSLSTGGRGFGTFLGSARIESNEERQAREDKISSQIQGLIGQFTSGSLSFFDFQNKLHDLAASDLVKGSQGPTGVRRDDLSYLLPNLRNLGRETLYEWFGFNPGVKATDFMEMSYRDNWVGEMVWKPGGREAYDKAILDAWPAFLEQYGHLFPPGSIPQAAAGGIVPARPGGTLVNVGEAGLSEAIIPLSAMRPSMMSEMGAVNLEATIVANVPLDVEVAKVTAAAARRGRVITGSYNRPLSENYEVIDVT